MQKKIDNNIIKSFANNRAKSFSVAQKEEFEKLLLKYSTQNHNLINTNIILDIGSGNGEFVIHKAQQNPDILYIASEVFDKGMYQCLKSIDLQHISNVQSFFGDSRLLINELIENNILLKKVYIMFPDPWPKKRHHKRRIVNESFLQLLYKLLEYNGKIIIATDHDDYQIWINEVLSNTGIQKIFSYKKTLYKDTDEYFETKFYKKSLAKQNISILFELTKIENV